MCSGLDKVNFEMIENMINKIFLNTHIQIIIHELKQLLKQNVFVNDNKSFVAQVDNE